MSTFDKTATFCAVGSFVGLIALAVVGHFLETHGLIRNRKAARVVTKTSAIILFVILGFSLIPVLLHVFVVAQGRIGNGELRPIRFAREHERGVTFAVWGVFTLGFLVALPVMWTDLFDFPGRRKQP